MKKLLALSISVVSGLASLQATSDLTGPVAALKSQNQTDNGCCAPCPPKPCCVPQPKKCINCECYVPSFYDLQCDWGMTSYVDFLYWYSNEGNMPYALVVTAVAEAPGAATPVVVASNSKHVGTNWDPGFRLGLGWNTSYDGWDVDANWTWYHNNKSNSTSVPATFSHLGSNFYPSVGQQAIIDPWVDAGVFHSAFADAGNTYLFDTVNSSWKLFLNQVDVSLGRKYWLSRSFTMRPYAGGRGAWATTNFRNQALRIAGVDYLDFTDTFKDKFWGVGLMTGFQPEWHISSTFSLFSNLDASLLWGKFKMRKGEDYTRLVSGVAQTAINNNFISNFSKMTTMVDLAFGLRWTENWCNYRYRAYFDAGWEHHIWFDTNNRLKTLGHERLNAITATNPHSFENFEEEVGNLMYGGLVIRARLDY